MRTAAVQRLRITFGIDGPLRYLSVLDMGRLWERLLQRAELPLAFTQGFNPHPRLAFAAPLPVGYSSTFELLDVALGVAAEPAETWRALAGHCPAGLHLQAVSIVPLDAPALQAVMRRADYEVTLWSSLSAEGVSARLQQALDSAALPYQRVRAGRAQTVDLRPLLLGASYHGRAETHRLHLTMVCSPQGAGRPEELLAALELPVDHWAICRTGLHWDSDVEV